MHGAFKEWTQMQLLETDVINRLLGLLSKKLNSKSINEVTKNLKKGDSRNNLKKKKKLTGSIQGR